jgi:circadian clock protein KaiC
LQRRTPIGVPGIDDLVGGGVPKGSILLLSGCPGSGKTLFAAKFIYEGTVSFGERGVYVCLTEPRDVFVNTMKVYGWDFEDLVARRIVELLDLSIETELDAQSALSKIVDAIGRLKAERVVLDSVTALGLGLKSELSRRHFLRLLYRVLRRFNCTSILIVETPSEYGSFGSRMEEFIADGIIHLDHYYDSDGILRRRLRILKMRGTKHGYGTYEYWITDKGFEVMKRAAKPPSASEPHPSS